MRPISALNIYIILPACIYIYTRLNECFQHGSVIGQYVVKQANQDE